MLAKKGAWKQGQEEATVGEWYITIFLERKCIYSRVSLIACMQCIEFANPS